MHVLFSNNSKRITFPEPFQSHRRRVFSWFTLGVAASLVLLSLFFLSNSLKVEVFVPPLHTDGANSSFVSCPFNANHSSSSENNASVKRVEEGSAVVNRTHEVHVSGNGSEGNMHVIVKPEENNIFENSSFSYNLVGIKNVTFAHNETHQEEKKKVGLHEKCDIFEGKWVRDYSKPYYSLGSCPFIDRDFDCHRNERPDAEYVKWKWQPNGCQIPSLNATDFLERLRGQRLVFVGDSLNRNMWESLVCILSQSIRNKKRVFEISGRREFKKKGVYSFRFEDYNCSVDFVVSPFIVQESTFKEKNGSFETLRLDLMDRTTTKYRDANIIVFNTGHWWTHDKTSKGENYYQEGNHVYPRLEVLDAYKRALTTWAKWVDRKIDANQTQVLFRGYSATHFWGGQWNSGGQCHRETEPIFNESYLQKYPSKMWALEHVIQHMKTPVIYMNVTRLTDFRKDGHPSVFRKEYTTSILQNTTALYEDCSHWCLPGVPDTWNELLYVSLLKYGKGTWKR
ncbi:protein trichome birefringence-like 2 [Abrus precatorius]|uniref:Protein trichome birefringence-like 2 n=1 Tax=Abrus precatorius TaxID=3816 RepID=A0A8B8KXP0_ABRPR|nr:protein trichome birefringence-like 2 [Abrus precatorius]